MPAGPRFARFGALDEFACYYQFTPGRHAQAAGAPAAVDGVISRARVYFSCVGQYPPGVDVLRLRRVAVVLATGPAGPVAAGGFWFTVGIRGRARALCA